MVIKVAAKLLVVLVTKLSLGSEAALSDQNNISASSCFGYQIAAVSWLPNSSCKLLCLVVTKVQPSYAGLLVSLSELFWLPKVLVRGRSPLLAQVTFGNKPWPQPLVTDKEFAKAASLPLSLRKWICCQRDFGLGLLVAKEKVNGQAASLPLSFAKHKMPKRR